MICHYENSKGEIIDFIKSPYRIITGDFFNYEWEAITYSGKIYGFERRLFEKELKLDVFCRQEEFAEKMNYLETVFSEDILNQSPGRLYVNGDYLSCYVRKVKKDEWEAGLYTVVSLTVVSDHPFWISEKSKSFYRKDMGISQEGLNFQFNFPFNFTTTGRGVDSWYVDHVTGSPFLMVIYGPVTNPRILINNYPYEVFTTLESNEYLIIDSHSHLIKKYMSNGTVVNLYDDRRKEESIFEPIDSGPLSFNWSGTFGFDLTVYMERSEPLWNSRN